MPTPDWFYLRKGSQPLEQGLIIPKFSFPKLNQLPLPSQKKTTDIDYEEFDAIILSQSCDLTGKNINYIQICPLETLNEMMNSDRAVQDASSDKKKKNAQDNLFKLYKQGMLTSQHMLNRLTDYQVRKLKLNIPNNNLDPSIKRFTGERLIANFKDSIVVPRSYLLSFIEKDNYYLAVNPPYREALAQKFGLFFMRVGNPVNYTKYDYKEYRILEEEL